MKRISILVLLTFIFISCGKDIDDDPNHPLNAKDFSSSQLINLEIKDFIWKGLNTYYLWQNDIPDLVDNRFASSLEKTIIPNEKYFNFLNLYPTPKNLFNALKYKNDRFSFITDDYVALEKSFQGVSKSTGMEFGLSYISKGSDHLIGIVEYVLPNTPAAKVGVKRGTLFTKVNGQTLTKHNYRQLLFSEEPSYTINSMNIENQNLIDNNQPYTLIKEEIEENPVFIDKVIEIDGKKIGYLMYNSFVSNFDIQLNETFGKFKATNIDALVLDLRYNRGGSMSSAVHLSSMITGQFNGQLLIKNRWNKKMQPIIEKEKWADSYFTDKIWVSKDSSIPINSLNMRKVYIIATGSTASASELVINGLKPYIEVVQIGTKTVGKNQGSITLKDYISEGKVNPNHTWAMQPIVLKYENANGFNDFEKGLIPDVELQEDLGNLGELGTPSEPMFAKAIALITGKTSRASTTEIKFPTEIFTDSKNENPYFHGLHLEGDFSLENFK